MATIRSHRYFKRTPLLRDVGIPTDFAWPEISVVVPACNAVLAATMLVAPFYASSPARDLLHATPLIAIRSAVIALRNGGVKWRTTFYPLAELRAHQRLNLGKILRKEL